MQTLSIDQLVGQVLGNYRVERLLGRGRLNAVYFARSLSPQQANSACALTLYLVPERFSPEAYKRFITRFHKEAAAITTLVHPHILPIYEYGEHEGYPYLVTPYMMNGSLADLLKRQGRLDQMAVLDILNQLVSGLSYAHQKGFIHGTLRPSNIVLNGEQKMQVAGFGLMHILQMRGIEQSNQPYGHLLSIADTFLAAPEYVAPEVVQGQFIDARSDIYALGCILYELLSGQPPFTGDNPLEVAKLHVSQTIPSLRTLKPDIPMALVSVVNQALDRDPARRFQQVSELAEAYAQAFKGATGQLVSEEQPQTSGRADSGREGTSAGGWQLQPPIVTGKIPRIDVPTNTVARPTQARAPRVPAPPTLGNTDAWNTKAPVTTGNVPAVKPTPATRLASAKYPAVPAPTAPKPEEPARPAPASPERFNSMPGANADTTDLVKAYEWWSQPEVTPPAREPARSPEPQPAQEPLRLRASGTVNWANDPAGFDMAGSMPSRSAGKKRSRGMSRRSAIALIATGGVAAAGVALALNLGHLHLPTSLTSMNANMPAATPTKATANKASGTTQAAQNKPQATTTAQTANNTKPAATGHTGTVVGTTTLAANKAALFTNPADNKPAWLIHLPNNSFVAFERACTHQGVLVNYDPATQTLVCPLHGSVFDPTNGGVVLQGPATQPLPKVNIHVNSDGTITV